MEMQKSMGGFEANIKDMRSDITKIEDTLKDSFVFPVTNRIIAITAIVGGSGIGISELLMG